MEDMGCTIAIHLKLCRDHCSVFIKNSRQLNKKEYDIVSMNGTFDGKSYNLTGSFADIQTGALIGGKINSLTVLTMCEIMLAEPLDITFFREFDSRTGQNELVVRRKLLQTLK